MQLGFDPAGFLREDWQRRPRLIRQGLKNFHNPLSPDELAGLACEDGAESRLVQRYDRKGRERWLLEHGPFPESRFGTLPERDWTLLVQSVDHWVDEVAAMLEPFRFLPDWRIDDVMVSYAAPGGSVGPHFDQYDVFLVQGLGRRRWQVGAPCDGTTPLQRHDSLRLLAQFEPIMDWVLDPGDILYLPPGFSHWGIGESDDCMTYSIGFRAPSQAELLTDWCDELLSHLGDDQRYRDPAGGIAANPGVIPPEALAQVRQLLLARLDEPRYLGDWFGRLVTRPKYDPGDADAVVEDWAGQALARNPASRFACLHVDADLLLFVDGDSQLLRGAAVDVALTLCRLRHYPAELTQDWARNAACTELVDSLLQRGKLLRHEPQD